MLLLAGLSHLVQILRSDWLVCFMLSKDCASIGWLYVSYKYSHSYPWIVEQVSDAEADRCARIGQCGVRGFPETLSSMSSCSRRTLRLVANLQNNHMKFRHGT